MNNVGEWGGRPILDEPIGSRREFYLQREYLNPSTIHVFYVHPNGTEQRIYEDQDYRIAAIDDPISGNFGRLVLIGQVIPEDSRIVGRRRTPRTQEESFQPREQYAYNKLTLIVQELSERISELEVGGDGNLPPPTPVPDEIWQKLMAGKDTPYPVVTPTDALTDEGVDFKFTHRIGEAGQQATFGIGRDTQKRTVELPKPKSELLKKFVAKFAGDGTVQANIYEAVMDEDAGKVIQIFKRAAEYMRYTLELGTDDGIQNGVIYGQLEDGIGIEIDRVHLAHNKTDTTAVTITSDFAVTNTFDDAHMAQWAVGHDTSQPGVDRWGISGRVGWIEEDGTRKQMLFEFTRDGAGTRDGDSGLFRKFAHEDQIPFASATSALDFGDPAAGSPADVKIDGTTIVKSVEGILSAPGGGSGGDTNWAIVNGELVPTDPEKPVRIKVRLPSGGSIGEVYVDKSGVSLRHTEEETGAISELKLGLTGAAFGAKSGTRIGDTSVEDSALIFLGNEIGQNSAMLRRKGSTSSSPIATLADIPTAAGGLTEEQLEKFDSIEPGAQVNVPVIAGVGIKISSLPTEIQAGQDIPLTQGTGTITGFVVLESGQHYVGITNNGHVILYSEGTTPEINLLAPGMVLTDITVGRSATGEERIYVCGSSENGAKAVICASDDNGISWTTKYEVETTTAEVFGAIDAHGTHVVAGSTASADNPGRIVISNGGDTWTPANTFGITIQNVEDIRFAPNSANSLMCTGQFQMGGSSYSCMVSASAGASWNIPGNPPGIQPGQLLVLCTCVLAVDDSPVWNVYAQDGAVWAWKQVTGEWLGAREAAGTGITGVTYDKIFGQAFLIEYGTGDIYGTVDGLNFKQIPSPAAHTGCILVNGRRCLIGGNEILYVDRVEVGDHISQLPPSGNNIGGVKKKATEGNAIQIDDDGAIWYVPAGITPGDLPPATRTSLGVVQIGNGIVLSELVAGLISIENGTADTSGIFKAGDDLEVTTDTETGTTTLKLGSSYKLGVQGAIEAVQDFANTVKSIADSGKAIAEAARDGLASLVQVVNGVKDTVQAIAGVVEGIEAVTTGLEVGTGIAAGGIGAAVGMAIATLMGHGKSGKDGKAGKDGLGGTDGVIFGENQTTVMFNAAKGVQVYDAEAGQATPFVKLFDVTQSAVILKEGTQGNYVAIAKGYTATANNTFAYQVKYCFKASVDVMKDPANWTTKWSREGVAVPGIINHLYKNQIGTAVIWFSGMPGEQGEMWTAYPANATLLGYDLVVGPRSVENPTNIEQYSDEGFIVSGDTDGHLQWVVPMVAGALSTYAVNEINIAEHVFPLQISCGGKNTNSEYWGMIVWRDALDAGNTYFSVLYAQYGGFTHIERTVQTRVRATCGYYERRGEYVSDVYDKLNLFYLNGEIDSSADRGSTLVEQESSLSRGPVYAENFNGMAKMYFEYQDPIAGTIRETATTMLFPKTRVTPPAPPLTTFWYRKTITAGDWSFLDGAVAETAFALPPDWTADQAPLLICRQEFDREVSGSPPCFIPYACQVRYYYDAARGKYYFAIRAPRATVESSPRDVHVLLSIPPFEGESNVTYKIMRADWQNVEQTGTSKWVSPALPGWGARNPVFQLVQCNAPLQKLVIPSNCPSGNCYQYKGNLEVTVNTEDIQDEMYVYIEDRKNPHGDIEMQVEMTPSNWAEWDPTNHRWVCRGIMSIDMKILESARFLSIAPLLNTGDYEDGKSNPWLHFLYASGIVFDISSSDTAWLEIQVMTATEPLDRTVSSYFRVRIDDES